MLKLMLLHGGKVTQGVLRYAARDICAENLDLLLQHGCVIDSDVLTSAVLGHGGAIFLQCWNLPIKELLLLKSKTCFFLERGPLLKLG